MKKIKDKHQVTKAYDIRYAAMIDVLNATTSNRTKKDDNNFTIHFKISIRSNDSITIYSAINNSKEVYKAPMKSPGLLDILKYNSRLARKRIGHVHFLHSQKKLGKYNRPWQSKAIGFDPRGSDPFVPGVQTKLYIPSSN